MHLKNELSSSGLYQQELDKTLLKTGGLMQWQRLKTKFGEVHGCIVTVSVFQLTRSCELHILYLSHWMGGIGTPLPTMVATLELLESPTYHQNVQWTK